LNVIGEVMNHLEWICRFYLRVCLFIWGRKK